LRVAIVTEDNRPIAGYGFDDCRGLTGDGISLAVTWKSRQKLPNAVRPRLKFELTEAKLFSFWIE
jgi:hypothetical protein